MKYDTVLLIPVSIFCFQFLNGVHSKQLLFEVSRNANNGGFKAPEMQNLVTRVMNDGKKLLMGKMGLMMLAQEKHQMLQDMVVSFNNLVKYVKNKKVDCLSSDILSVYNLTLNADDAGINACCDNSVPNEAILDTINRVTQDLFNRLKPVDASLYKLNDEAKRRQLIAEANWIISKDFKESYFMTSTKIVNGLRMVEACCDDVFMDLTDQVKSSVRKLKDCVHK